MKKDFFKSRHLSIVGKRACPLKLVGQFGLKLSDFGYITGTSGIYFFPPDILYVIPTYNVAHQRWWANLVG